MMFFLQDSKESDAMRIEIEELREVLDNQSFSDDVKNRYAIVDSSYFTNYDDTFFSREWMKQYAVPVGSIEFVQTYLHEFYGISHMSPIEIPVCLRLPHLLLRDYNIVTYEGIPKEGKCFIKDVTQLKNWTYMGDVRNLFAPEFEENNNIDKSHFFQVSDILPILSEYRVIVMDDKIYGIQFYDGDPTIMPTPREIKKIKEMVVRYSVDKTHPMAYAMDVAVVKADNEEKRDLAIVEICPATSCGLYGCRGAFLPKMYELGIKWYIEHNKPIKPTE